MIKKIQKFGGLDLRTHEFQKPETAATIAENVELNSEGYLVSRDGYQPLNDTAGCRQLIPYFNRQDNREELIGVFSEGLKRLDGTAWVDIPVQGSTDFVSTFTIPDRLDFVTTDGLLYMTDITGVLRPLKYDGESLYWMGLPVTRVQTTSSTGTAPGNRVYLLTVYEYTDYQGNKYTSPFLFPFEDERVGTGVAFTTTWYTINDFYTNLLGEEHGYFNGARNYKMKFYVSESLSFGYRLVAEEDFSPTDATVSTSISDSEITTALSEGEPLSNIKDISVPQSAPPIGRYIEMYNNQVVIGNYVEEDSLSPTEALSTNTVDRSNGIIWSDTSTGQNKESFPVLNFDEAGKGSNVITGLFGESDNLHIFKEDNLFYLSGTLFDLSYRIRDSLSEGIGCISYSSIVRVSNGCFFLSKKGIYFSSDGAKPTEFSDLIEPLFVKDTTGLELDKAVSTLDRIKEKIYLFIPATDSDNSIVVQYDFYHGQWFLYKGMDASGGFSMFQDELYHNDGSELFLRGGARDDNDSISCKYATKWLDEGVPSLKKKFTQWLLFNVFGESFPISVSSQINWSDASLNTEPNPVMLGGEDTDVDGTLSATSAKSLRLIMEAEVLDVPLEINSLEYEVEVTQTRFKGSS